MCQNEQQCFLSKKVPYLYVGHPPASLRALNPNHLISRLSAGPRWLQALSHQILLKIVSTQWKIYRYNKGLESEP